MQPYRETPRDYTTPAVITLVLYFFFWVPGLIANLAYISSARNEQHRTGESPHGSGCLWSMLWLFVLLPAAVFVIALVSALSSHPH